MLSTQCLRGVDWRLHTINFRNTVQANNVLGLVSARIDRPFRTKKVNAKFALNQAGLLHVYTFISQDPNIPAALPVSGQNLLSYLHGTQYIAGDDETKTYDVEIPNPFRGAYIKIFADNTDANAHTLDIQITIEMAYNIELPELKHPREHPSKQFKPYDLELEMPTRRPSAIFPEAADYTPARQIPARERQHGLTLPIQGERFK